MKRKQVLVTVPQGTARQVKIHKFGRTQSALLPVPWRQEFQEMCPIIPRLPASCEMGGGRPVGESTYNSLPPVILAAFFLH